MRSLQISDLRKLLLIFKLKQKKEKKRKEISPPSGSSEASCLNGVALWLPAVKIEKHGFSMNQKMHTPTSPNKNHVRIQHFSMSRSTSNICTTFFLMGTALKDNKKIWKRTILFWSNLFLLFSIWILLNVV